MIALYLRETIQGNGVGSLIGLERLQFGSWRAQYRLWRENHSAFDKVLQFTDVSRPLVTHQRIHRIGGDYVNSFVHALSVEFREMPHQSWNILDTLSQGRNVDREDFQTVVKVFAKRSLFDHGGQIPMRGCNQADVNLMRTVAAEPLEFLLLQDPQQFRLKFQRDIANLVKKQRAFVGEFEPSRFLGDGAGKGSFFMAEKLTLKKSKRDCRAVQLHECLFTAIPQLMYRTRNQFFAGARLSQDQHTRIRRRYDRYHAQRRLQRWALS